MLNEDYCVEKKIIFVTKQQFVDLLRPCHREIEKKISCLIYQKIVSPTLIKQVVVYPKKTTEGFTAKDVELGTTIDTIPAELTKSQLQQRINTLLCEAAYGRKDGKTYEMQICKSICKNDKEKQKNA